MKRYELKDKELQTALEKAFPGFGEALQASCENTFDDITNYVEVSLDKCYSILFRDKIDICKSAITTKEVYDPHAWNNFPQVTPPEGVPMRVEGQYAKRPELEYYGALVYLEGAWHFADTSEIADNVIVERFRPWDEESAK
nr:MAG TPA: hypothetical protein [Caudoviricetes sp.]